MPVLTLPDPKLFEMSVCFSDSNAIYRYTIFTALDFYAIEHSQIKEVLILYGYTIFILLRVGRMKGYFRSLLMVALSWSVQKTIIYMWKRYSI